MCTFLMAPVAGLIGCGLWASTLLTHTAYNEGILRLKLRMTLLLSRALSRSFHPLAPSPARRLSRRSSPAPLLPFSFFLPSTPTLPSPSRRHLRSQTHPS